MNSSKTIHVLPIEGHWAVMTDERRCIHDHLDSKEEAIKAAGQEAAGGEFAYMVIHAKDDLKPKSH